MHNETEGKLKIIEACHRAINEPSFYHFPHPQKITIHKAKILCLVLTAVKCGISLLGKNKCSRTNYMKDTYVGLHNAKYQRNRKKPHKEIFMT